MDSNIFDRMECITIYTDAAYNYNSKIGTYAIIIECEKFTLKTSGVFKPNRVKNSHQAEMATIGNALTILQKHPEAPQTKQLMVYTDSEHAILMIKQKRGEWGKESNLLEQLIGAELAKKC